MTTAPCTNTRRSEELVIEEEAILLSEQILTRFSAEGASFCYLLLDPAMRNPLAPLEAISEKYGKPLKVGVVGISKTKIARDKRPVLVQLDLTSFVDTELCRAAAQMALNDWGVEGLRNGDGHRLGGWIFSSSNMPDLTNHMASQAVRRRPNGRLTWIRFQDPRVMDFVAGIFTDPQKRELCGSASAWYWLGRWGMLDSIGSHSKTLSQSAGNSETLTVAQWEDIDAIGTLNRLWLRVRHAGHYLDRATMRQLRDSLARARGYGFNDIDDLVEFGWRAKFVHPMFDFHPAIRSKIEQRKSGDFFGYVTADVEESQWHLIHTEMKQTDKQSVAVTELTGRKHNDGK